MRDKLFILSALVSLLTLSACYSTVPAGEAAQPNAIPGTFSVFAMTNYLYPPDRLNGWGLKRLQSRIHNSLTAGGWQDQGDPQDDSVDVNALTNAAASSDALFVLGHGDAGDIWFTNMGNSPSVDEQYWGVGSNGDGNPDIHPRVPQNLDGTPLGGKLKWMFLFTSVTVAPPYSFDPNDPDQSYVAPTGSWERVFGTSSGHQKLRGIYGYWMPPGYCPWDGSDPRRRCDLTTQSDGEVVPDLLGKLWTSQGSSGAYNVQDAWISANQDVKDWDTPDIWAIEEDCYASGDTFMSGDSTLPFSNLAHQLCYEAPGGSVPGIAGPRVIPLAATFTLAPVALIPRPVNVPALIQKAEANYPIGAVTERQTNAIQTYESQQGQIVNVYYGDSGGITVDGHRPENAVLFSEADAQNAAVDFIRNSFTMPGDARLESIIPVYRQMPSARSRVLIGYQFTWRHADGVIRGGDAVSVDVYDRHLTHFICAGWGFGPHHQPICINRKVTYSDSPTIPYAYYLWRELGNQLNRSISYAGRASGGKSIDAYSASLSLKNRGMIVSYYHGYWVGGLTGNGKIAHPAWFFRLSNGGVSAVDAFSGRQLGESLY